MTGAVRAVRSKYGPLLPCFLSLAGVVACTWISFRLGQNLASVGFLYLVFVVLAAVYGGFWQATLISVISVACLDYFFNEPIFSFSVDRISNWVELGAFEFTAVVISRLSNRAQLRALEADAERRETVRLYQTARRILLWDSHGNPGDLVGISDSRSVRASRCRVVRWFVRLVVWEWRLRPGNRASHT